MILQLPMLKCLGPDYLFLHQPLWMWALQPEVMSTFGPGTAKDSLKGDWLYVDCEQNQDRRSAWIGLCSP